MFRVTKAKYLTSAVNINGWITDEKLEILFLGRSNVGKSSFLNMLTNYQGLAKVSQKPGKTQMLNFFDINNGECRFVDAPGYGFARVNNEKKIAFSDMMSDYLLKRKNLRLVCLLIDLRRIPNNDDLNMIEYLKFHHLRYAIIGTKIDKLSNNQRNNNLRKICQMLSLDINQIILTSAVKKQGINECNELIESILKL